MRLALSLSDAADSDFTQTGGSPDKQLSSVEGHRSVACLDFTRNPFKFLKSISGATLYSRPISDLVHVAI